MIKNLSEFICHMYYGKLNFVLQFFPEKMFKFFFNVNKRFSDMRKFMYLRDGLRMKTITKRLCEMFFVHKFSDLIIYETSWISVIK